MKRTIKFHLFTEQIHEENEEEKKTTYAIFVVLTLNSALFD